MPKTERIEIRVTPALKQMAKNNAEREGRTVSNWIVNILNKELQKRKK